MQWYERRGHRPVCRTLSTSLVPLVPLVALVPLVPLVALVPLVPLVPLVATMRVLVLICSLVALSCGRPQVFREDTSVMRDNQAVPSDSFGPPRQIFRRDSVEDQAIAAS